jgi:hypothetical protein
MDDHLAEIREHDGTTDLDIVQGVAVHGTGPKTLWDRTNPAGLDRAWTFRSGGHPLKDSG